MGVRRGWTGAAATPMGGNGGARTVSFSKWLKSGVGRKSPPHRPPRAFHSVPRNAQTSVAVVLAGVSPTRKSTASEGH